MWASWVSEPIGVAVPARAASTPAMKVEATAPMPGVSTPRRPVAGAMEVVSVMGEKPTVL